MTLRSLRNTFLGTGNLATECDATKSEQSGDKGGTTAFFAILSLSAILLYVKYFLWCPEGDLNPTTVKGLRILSLPRIP